MTARTLGILAGLLTFVLVLQPVVAQPADAGSVSISIRPVTASTGSETNVPINIRTGTSRLGALQFDLTYDPAVLEAVKVDPGRLLSGLTDFNITSPGRMRIALATSEGISGEGEILVASFRVLREGQSSLRIENARAWEQATSFETTVQVEPGLVTVEAPGSFPVVAVVIGLVVLGGLLLILAIVAILLLKRKRGAAAPTYAPATGVPAAAGPLRCTCGQALMAGTRFCPSCGATSANASSRCPSCGTQTTPGARFCRTCGQPVAQ